MTPILVGAVLAGLVGSPHCVGMCGGFATAASRPAEAVAWHAGRLTTYATLGAFAGTAGSLRGGPFSAVIAAVLLVWFAARLAGLVPATPVHLPWLTRAGARFARTRALPARFVFGVLTGLLPCGLVWSALAMAIAAGGGVAGALTMAAFWTGTIPLLATAAGGLRRLGGTGPWTRRALAAGVLAAGLWSISARVSMQQGSTYCYPHEAR